MAAADLHCDSHRHPIASVCKLPSSGNKYPSQEVTATAGDVIGDPSGTSKGVMANLFTRGPGQQKKTAEVFAVGDRGAILHHLDQAAIIPHVVESENRKIPYEVNVLTLSEGKPLSQPCAACYNIQQAHKCHLYDYFAVLPQESVLMCNVIAIASGKNWLARPVHPHGSCFE